MAAPDAPQSLSDLLSSEDPASSFAKRNEATTAICRRELTRAYASQVDIKQADKKEDIPLGPFPILHTSDLFSFDQIWQQLDTRNKVLMPYISKRINALAANAAVASTSTPEDLMDAPVVSSDDGEQDEHDGILRDDEGNVDDDGDDKENREDCGMLDPSNHDQADESDAPAGDNSNKSNGATPKRERRVHFSIEENDKDEKPSRKNQGNAPSSSGGVEDGFFSFADMEAFADDAEMLANQGKLIASDDDEDDDDGDGDGDEDEGEDGIDKRADGDDDDNDEFDIDGASTKDKHNFLYSDFFDPVDEADAGESEIYASQAAARRRALLLDEAEENDEKDEVDIGNEDEKEVDEEETNLQKRRAKMRKAIEAIEDANVSAKPWMLRGEVSAASRPKDSLLDTELSHDVSGAPKSFVSSEMNEDLEDVIKQRIVDGLFDDVVMALPDEYEANKKGEKKELPEISQEKPTESLADVYEREYNEEQEEKKKQMLASQSVERNEDKPETEEQKEVNDLFSKLAKKLDALTSLHFKPTEQDEKEIEVKSNVKAISKEEAIPDAVSDGNLLAPREVFSVDDKKAKGEREKSKDERRANRRRNKTKGKKSKVMDEAAKNAKTQADPVLADKRRAENALARRGKKAKNTDGDASGSRRSKEVDASFAKAAMRARLLSSKQGEPEKKGKSSMSASQLTL